MLNKMIKLINYYQHLFVKLNLYIIVIKIIILIFFNSYIYYNISEYAPPTVQPSLHRPNYICM